MIDKGDKQTVPSTQNHSRKTAAIALIHELIEKADADFPYAALAINLVTVALEKGGCACKSDSTRLGNFPS